jgi:hypothetical protein
MVALVSLAGMSACDPVCDIARVAVVASDARAGVPCVFELQRSENAPQPPFSHGPKGQTGAVFTLHTYRSSGTYRLAAQCEGYALATTPTFEWRLEGMGCGRVAELGTITVNPAGSSIPLAGRSRPTVNGMTPVEELIADFESKSRGVQRVDLWVPENLTLLGEPVPSDVGMAVLVDRVLALEFEPNGYTASVGGRTYHYKRWE